MNVSKIQENREKNEHKIDINGKSNIFFFHFQIDSEIIRQRKIYNLVNIFFYSFIYFAKRDMYELVAYRNITKCKRFSKMTFHLKSAIFMT